MVGLIKGQGTTLWVLPIRHGVIVIDYSL